MSAAVELLTCANPTCGNQFERRSAQHAYCSDKCRWQHRDRVDPNAIHNNRLRCARWAEKNRGVKGSNPWLLGAPPFDEYLPGAGLEMRFTPNIRFEHRQLSALHGAVTSLTGPHDPNVPRFCLVPWSRGCGWGVWLTEDALVEQLAGTEHKVRLGHGTPLLHFGTRYRIKAPRVTKRGHRKLRIDAITPVCVRCTNGSDGSYKLYTAPTGGNLRSTLTLMTPKRIGLLVDESTIKLELVERHTQPATLSLAGRSGRLGNMRGWVGYVIVETNAVGHWLFEVAARIGFGGTTSFGFGRIAISAAD